MRVKSIKEVSEDLRKCTWIIDPINEQGKLHIKYSAYVREDEYAFPDIVAFFVLDVKTRYSISWKLMQYSLKDNQWKEKLWGGDLTTDLVAWTKDFIENKRWNKHED